MDEEVKKHNQRFAWGWSIFMGVLCAFISVPLGIFIFLAYLAYFLWISPLLEKRRKQRVENVYRKFLREMPEATGAQREWAVQKYLMKRQMIKAAAMFFGGCATLLLVPILLTQWLSLNVPEILLNLIMLAGGVVEILGVFVFARSLHDPLTPAEAKELEERERIEKTGQ